MAELTHQLIVRGDTHTNTVLMFHLIIYYLVWSPAMEIQSPQFNKSTTRWSECPKQIQNFNSHITIQYILGPQEYQFRENSLMRLYTASVSYTVGSLAMHGEGPLEIMDFQVFLLGANSNHMWDVMECPEMRFPWHYKQQNSSHSDRTDFKQLKPFAPLPPRMITMLASGAAQRMTSNLTQLKVLCTCQCELKITQSFPVLMLKESAKVPSGSTKHRKQSSCYTCLLLNTWFPNVNISKYEVMNVAKAVWLNADIRMFMQQVIEKCVWTL